MRRFFAIVLFAAAGIAALTGPATCATAGYYDFNGGTGWANPIAANGLTAVRITDASISTFDFAALQMLAVDSWSTTPLLNRLGSIQTWVSGGGKLIVHDWYPPNGAGNPFLFGASGISTVWYGSADIDVPSGSPLASGPFGSLDNASLDGGNWSAHGYALTNTLPSQAKVLLTEGAHPNGAVSFMYGYGSGYIYYSCIPSIYYLENYFHGQPLLSNMNNIYAPNLIAYMNAVPEPSSLLALITGLGGLGGLMWRNRR